MGTRESILPPAFCSVLQSAGGRIIPTESRCAMSKRFNPSVGDRVSAVKSDGRRQNAVLTGFYHGAARVQFTGGRKDGFFAYVSADTLRRPRRVRKVRMFGAVVGRVLVEG
jgi:hypothetical protein